MSKRRISKDTTTELMGLVAGALGAKAVNKVIPSSVPEQFKGIGKVALGLFLPGISKKTKILKPIGQAMIVVGTIEAAHHFAPGFMAGLEGVGDDIYLDTVNGAPSEFLNGPGDEEEFV